MTQHVGATQEIWDAINKDLQQIVDDASCGEGRWAESLSSRLEAAVAKLNAAVGHEREGYEAAIAASFEIDRLKANSTKTDEAITWCTTHVETIIAERDALAEQVKRKSDAVQRLWKERDALAAKLAALAQQGEPVAWMRKDEDMITAKEKRPDYAYTKYYDMPLYTAAPAPQPVQQAPDGQTLWLWKNSDHYLAFDNFYPCFTQGGDPMTLGEPFMRAIFRKSYGRESAAPAPAQDVPETNFGNMRELSDEEISKSLAEHCGYPVGYVEPCDIRAVRAVLEKARMG